MTAPFNIKKASFYFGLIMGPVLIYFLFKNTDLTLLWSKLIEIRFSFIIIILLTTVSQSCAVIAWYLTFPHKVTAKADVLSGFIIKVKTKIYRRLGVVGSTLHTLQDLFEIRLIGESLSQVNPINLVAGETFKALLLKKWLGVEYRYGAVSILTSRILLMLSMLLLAVFTGSILFIRFDLDELRMIAYIFPGIVLLFYVYFFFMLRREHGLFYFISRFIRKFFSHFPFFIKAAQALEHIDVDMIHVYKNRKGAFYAAFLFSILHLVIGASEYYIIFRALGIDVSYFTCIVFDLSSTTIRSLVFFVPGQLGFEELTNRIMFSLVDLSGDYLWQTVSIIRRGRQFFWILTGFIYYTVISKSIKDPDLCQVNGG